jgi:dipeptidase E
MKLYLTSLKLDGLTKLLDKKPADTSVLFIPTAANVYEDKWFMEADRQWFIEKKFHLTELDLANSSKSVVRSAVSIIDVVYLSGGNSFYLLDHIKKSGFDIALKEHLKRGLIYAGGSAGAVVAGMSIEVAKEFDDPQAATGLTDYAAMKLINFSLLPHYGNDKYIQNYIKALANTPAHSSPVLTLTDNQALIVNDTHYQVIDILNS